MKKFILVLFLLATMLIPNLVFAEETYPIVEISTPQEWNELAEVYNCKSSYTAKNGNRVATINGLEIHITSNLDFNNIEVEVFGDQDNPFNGKIVGESANNRIVISNIKGINGMIDCGYDGVVEIDNITAKNFDICTGENASASLVSRAKKAIVKNCRVENSTINGYLRAGALVGEVLDWQLNILNCEVVGCTIYANEYVGGCVGHVYNAGVEFKNTAVTDCTIYATSDRDPSVGGIIGGPFAVRGFSIYNNLLLYNVILESSETIAGVTPEIASIDKAPNNDFSNISLVDIQLKIKKDSSTKTEIRCGLITIGFVKDYKYRMSNIFCYPSSNSDWKQMFKGSEHSNVDITNCFMVNPNKTIDNIGDATALKDILNSSGNSWIINDKNNEGLPYNSYFEKLFSKENDNSDNDVSSTDENDSPGSQNQSTNNKHSSTALWIIIIILACIIVWLIYKNKKKNE